MKEFFCSYQFISIIGLTIDIVGVIILFYTGLPFKLPERDLYIEEPITKQQEKKDKKQKCLAYLGLSLLILGFVVQILASIMSFN